MPTEEESNGMAGATSNTGMPGTSGTAGGTATAGATGTTVQQPYSQFSGNTYQELEDFLREQMKAVKPETEEERKKREKREKVNGIISGISDMGRALANLYFTSQYAPNAYQGETMSDKYQARLDKAKAQRDKDLDRYYNYALNLGKIREGDKGFNFKVEQARLQQANADRAYALNQERETRLNGQYELNAKKIEWQQQMAEKKFNLEEARLELQRMVAEKEISLEQARLEEARIRHELQEYNIQEEVERDDKGRVVRRTKTRTVNNGGSNNTPPSRQGGNENNTPPSRRR